ncbi:MAG TPA: BrnT family toxin [Terriglobia bacterium]|nr:BrnT family toxin [Terriglobia bacterium]
MFYEWNSAKAKVNLQKPGVSFDEAATVFLDPLAWTFPDPVHSGEEEREITIGISAAHRVIFVSHCQRGRRMRIISARMATGREREQYEEGIDKEIG